MTRMNSKNRLWLTVIALVLCFAMLIGTTWAFFTDSASSSLNRIEAGELDVVLKWSSDFAAWEEVTETTAIFGEDVRWEPGYLQAAYLEVSNAGTLALQYNLTTIINKEVEGTNQNGEKFRLSEYLTIAYVDDVQARYADRDAAKTVVEALGKNFNEEGLLVGSLLPGESKRVAILIYMPTDVGNVANARSKDELPEIHFGVMLNATQLAHEEDAFGKDYDVDAGFRTDLEYAPLKDGSGLVVTGIGTYPEAVVRIPAKVDGKPVVGIASTAFRNLMRITKVELPETLSYIEGGAFLGSDRLQSITPAAGNTYFKTENNALYSADGSRLVWYPDAAGRIELPQTVTTIASYAFAGRERITQVIVPSTLSAVGVGAFDGCTALQFNKYENGYYIGNDQNPYVALIKLDAAATAVNPHPDNKVIADGALANCPNLNEVTIPAGVTVLNQWMLQGSPNVTVITVPISVKVIGELAFAGLEKLETVVIPESVTEIGDGAFKGCTSLEKVTIPQDATLGENVFEGCDSLTDVTFSSTTTTVPAGTFNGCDSLTNVSGLGALTNVGDNAFAGCVELKGDIYISQDAVVGSNAFSGCTNDELNLVIKTDTVGIPDSWADDWSGTTTVRVHYASTYSHDRNAHWYSCLESGCGYQSAHTAHTFDYTDDYCCTVCDRQDYIKNQSYGLAIQNGIVVGKGTCIDSTIYINMPVAANAFYNDNTVETVVFNSGVSSIGANAFGADSDLGKLKHVVFPFADCSGLTVAEGLFVGNRNSGLKVFVPTAAVDAYKALGVAGGDWQTNVAPLIVGCEMNVLDALASMYVSTDSSTFTVSGSTITGFASGKQAAYRDSARDNLVIPTIVNGQVITKISNTNYAQYTDSFSRLRLDHLVIAGGITQMDAYIYSCNINTVILGDNVASIRYQGFNDTDIGTIVIGKALKTVGAQAFLSSSVGTVYYRGTPEDWAQISFNNEYNGNNAIKNAKRYYYSEVDPNTYIENYSGNYWHYDEYGEIAVWAKS